MTTTSMNEVYEKFLALTEDERRVLLARMQQAVPEAVVDDDMDDAWLEKMQGRLARMKSGESRRFRGDEAKAEVMRRLAARKK